MIVYSQNGRISLPREKIDRTEVQKKGEHVWIVVAVVNKDRALTLARYNSEHSARWENELMWECKDEAFQFGEEAKS